MSSAEATDVTETGRTGSVVAISKRVCKAVNWHIFHLLMQIFPFLPCLPKGTCRSLIYNCYFSFCTLSRNYRFSVPTY